MYFNDLLHKLHQNGRYPPQVMLETIVGNMIGCINFNEFGNNIPATDEFYNNLCANLDALGVGTDAEYDEPQLPMFPFNFIEHVLSHHLSHNSSSESTEGEMPLDLWFREPLKLSEYILQNTSKAEECIQSYCSRYSTNDKLTDNLAIVFNAIPLKHDLRQRGIDKDLIALAIKFTGLPLSRNAFKRNAESFCEIMSMCKLRCINSEEKCTVCFESSTSLPCQKDLHLMYMPYTCEHKICDICIYNLHFTTLGDYCPTCRSVLF